VLESFHDALAALHSVDAAKVADASLGPNGITDVIEYWRTSLLDATARATVPRQLALLDWLREHLPSDADDTPAVCMGDARLVNGLIARTEIRALVDFEVAYLGHPAADIGYSLFFDGLQRRSAEQPLPGIPSPEEAWTRWSRATGRDTSDRDYWTAFGAMVLCITATRAMLQWGLAEATVETDSPLVTAWEQTVQRATTSSTT
jgi:aminoglycoside phosphotransferase (APT) family kinase protein